MPPPVLPQRQSSIAFARERDARLCRLLGMHPVTAAMLVKIRWFPSKKKALRRLSRLVARKRIRLVGTICEKPGRPENVYCRWTPKVDHLLHEVQITDLCLRLHAEKILRGPFVLATDIRPDAEVWINGALYFLEWDRGTMSYGQLLRDRFAKYEGRSELVLWVCQTDIRREGLRLRAERIRHAALFTTASESLRSPHDTIWVGYLGETVALPRHQSNRAC